MRRAALLCLLPVAAVACDSNLEAEVGGATLAQAYGATAVPEAARAAPVVAVRKGAPPPSLPAGPVRLAIDIRTPWSEVRSLLDGAAATGSQPVLLVGQRHRVRAFVLDDPRPPGAAIRLDPDATGTFCLSPPGAAQKYCVQTGDQLNISAIFVREAVQKAVREYGLPRIVVRPTDDLRWGNLVRTVDGARSCCDTPVTVTVVR